MENGLLVPRLKHKHTSTQHFRLMLLLMYIRAILVNTNVKIHNLIARSNVIASMNWCHREKKAVRNWGRIKSTITSWLKNTAPMYTDYNKTTSNSKTGNGASKLKTSSTSLSTKSRDSRLPPDAIVLLHLLAATNYYDALFKCHIKFGELANWTHRYSQASAASKDNMQHLWGFPSFLI